jgi:hypothetical protein
MKKPNFFIICASKCGATSLVDWLVQYPQAFFNKVKELHYFKTDDSFRFIQNEDSYQDLFRVAGVEPLAIGEGSTWDFFSETAVPGIERFMDRTSRYTFCPCNHAKMVHFLHGQIYFSGDEGEPDFRKAWDGCHTAISHDIARYVVGGR